MQNELEAIEWKQFLIEKQARPEATDNNRVSTEHRSTYENNYHKLIFLP